MNAAARTEALRAAAPKPAEALAASSNTPKPVEALAASNAPKPVDPGVSGEVPKADIGGVVELDASDPAISGVVLHHLAEGMLEDPAELRLEPPLRPEGERAVGAAVVTSSGTPAIAVPLRFDDVTSVGQRRKTRRMLTALGGLAVGVAIGVTAFVLRGQPLAGEPVPFTQEAPSAAEVQQPEALAPPAAETIQAPVEQEALPPNPALETERPAVRFEDLPVEPVKAILSFNSIPVSKIRLDGKTIGETPKRGVAVPPGKRTIVFVHPTEGTRTRIIEVEPGQRRTVSVKF